MRAYTLHIADRQSRFGHDQRSQNAGGIEQTDRGWILYFGDFKVDHVPVLLRSFESKIWRQMHVADLLFTDTDSLCCEIETRDLYEDFGEMLDELETSNFDASLPQYSTDNRRVLGKFKCETGSVAPNEFVGLRAKMYSLHVPGDPRKSFKKAKRIQKHYAKNEVNPPTTSSTRLRSTSCVSSLLTTNDVF